MPSTGTPSARSCGSAVGAPGSNTEFGPPDRTIPRGSNCLMNARSVPRAAGWISQYTCASRTRREKIARLADRADDVDQLFGPGAVLERHDLVMGVVMAGPHEVRHAGVHDDELLAARVLAVQHLGEQHARVGDEVAPRLAHQREARLPDRRRHRLRERGGGP